MEPHLELRRWPEGPPDPRPMGNNNYSPDLINLRELLVVE
jgi:hypothetical protein